ncbi:hypothetical protein JRO89_XS14G0030300 [Xanthoceras sorbifolium]|uniref:X8 domain-containing protein n=1 Tax=Xanthoceras sorbifolium TaxID=99658 RepID=A0ABQ8H3I0_9ROSI|nr:hypothetical protein JRO89_XS14G0030300 [Xanthoceras sorbifolium]
MQIPTSMSKKISTTALLFTILLLHLAATTLSTDVKHDSSAKEHQSRTHARGSTPEKKLTPRFRINPGRPRKALIETVSGFNRAAKSDHKPTTPEKKAPPRFRTKPVKPRNVQHLAKKPHIVKKPIPSQPKRKTPAPPPAHFHKKTAPTKPHSDQVLHANIEYACKKGVDCKSIQKGGDCFDDSSSLRSRASFVMNAFYNINGRKDFNCYFGRSGLLTSTNPSYGKCIYM